MVFFKLVITTVSTIGNKKKIVSYAPQNLYVHYLYHGEWKISIKLLKTVEMYSYKIILCIGKEKNIKSSQPPGIPYHR